MVVRFTNLHDDDGGRALEVWSSSQLSHVWGKNLAMVCLGWRNLLVVGLQRLAISSGHVLRYANQHRGDCDYLVDAKLESRCIDHTSRSSTARQAVRVIS